MKGLRIFLIGLSIFLFAIVFYFSFVKFHFFEFKGDQIRIKFNCEVRTQRVRDRIWRKIELGDSLLSVPYWGGVKVDMNGNIYSWDYSYRLNKYSPDGKLVMRYGKGKGMGPGEFMMPISFDVDSFGRVWVADASTGLIQIFMPDGKFYRSVRTLSMPYRIKVLDRERFVIIKSTPADNFFEVYDINGKLLKSFGFVFSYQSKWPIVFTGDIDIWGRGLYLVFHYLGYICCFDFDTGEMKYIAETMDVGIPKFKVAEVGGKQIIKITEGSEIASLQFLMHDGKIFINSGSGLKARQTIIDVYSSNDGVYLYSYKIPMNGFLKGNFFYQSKDTMLIKWSLRDK
jgi:hypothetical protein